MVYLIVLALFATLFYYFSKYLTIVALVEEDYSLTSHLQRIATFAISIAFGVAAVIETGRAIVK